MKKKVLLSSILTIALCLSLIAGSTFALFTDKEEFNITVTSGTVDITATLALDKVWSVVPVEGGSIVDEYDGTYEYNYSHKNTFKNGGTAIVNGAEVVLNDITPGDKVDLLVSGTSSSDVKVQYRYVIECTEGLELMEGLLVYVNGATEGIAAMKSYTTAWAEAPATFSLPITIELPVTAGNKYQDKTAKIKVLVEAVQDNADVTNPAEEIVTFDTVAYSVNELSAALAAGESVVLGSDIVLGNASWNGNSTINITEDVVIDLNGYDLDASASTRRPFELSNGADLTIDATGATVKVGKYGLVYIPEGASNVTLVGGNYVGETDKGSFIKPNGSDAISITLNDVKYTDTSASNWLIDATSYNGSELNVAINGGEFNVVNGVTIHNATATVKGATLNVVRFGIEAGAGTNLVVEDCAITVDGAYSSAAPNACVAASDTLGIGSSATVKNCTLTSNVHIFAIYSGATTTLNAEGCTITHTGSYDANAVYGDAVIGNIIVK